MGVEGDGSGQDVVVSQQPGDREEFQTALDPITALLLLECFVVLFQPAEARRNFEIRCKNGW